MVDGKTNIQINRTTRAAIAALGGKDDTYDDIIVRLIHQRNILAIHIICKDMEEFDKGIVQNVFDTIGYTVPSTFVDYDGTVKEWETDPLNWAIEMAQDEDFVGAYRENVPVSETVTNIYCLLEQIDAPTWSMSVRMKNPFTF